MNEKANKKILIIIGSAPCLLEDLSAFFVIPARNRVCDYMVIGLDAVEYIRPIKYFATYHPAEIKEAKKRRADAHGNPDYMIISHMQYDGLVNMIIPLVGVPSGSSALLGVHAGIKLGYEKIVVFGCPLIGKNSKGASYETFRAGWTAKLAEIKEKTRSMSGWTKDLLGAPTPPWLGENITIPAAEVIQNHDEGQLHER